MIRLFVAIAFLVNSSIAYADNMDKFNETVNKIGNSVCQANMKDKEKSKEYKSLKMTGSKLDGICLLTAKTAYTGCLETTMTLAKGFLKTKARAKGELLAKKAGELCVYYTDIAAFEVVDMVAEKALKEKISIDDATIKVAEDAQKSSK